MRWFSKKRTIALLITPTLAFYTCYIIYSIIVAFYYSMTDFTGVGVAEFIGLDNYRALLRDENFYIAMKNTIVTLTVAFAVLLPGSFCVALLLNRKFRGASAVKAFVFSPNIIAPILVGLMWVYILDPHMGFINAALDAIDLEGWKQEWIGGRTLTPYSVAVIYAWQCLGFNATIFLAGLKMIPKELYEASSIDGANAWQKLLHITLPAIKQTIIINVLLIITGSFKIFETIYQLTGGGPDHLSENLVTLMYYTTFRTARYGYGMSYAVVTFLLSAAFMLIYRIVVRSGFKKEAST